MFGYSQGVIAAVMVQPPFLRRFFGATVTMDQIQAGATGIDPYLQGVHTIYLPVLVSVSDAP